MKYEAKKRGKMEGARKTTFDAIDALKPYKGGNDLLWVLYRLNNIDKHRLLITVGSQAAGVNLGQMMAGHMCSLGSGAPQAVIDSIEGLNLFLNPSDKGFPLEAGFELLIGAVDEKPNPKQQFRFSVALSELGVIEGKPLLETIHQLTALVEGIVTALTPLLE